MRGTKFLCTLLLMFATLLALVNPAEAVIGKGQAIIVGGDMAAARAEAKRQAMREAIEQAVGVRVESQTEVQNFMVISDEISMRSDGYGIVNRVVSEKVVGEILYLELDITASADKIRSTVQDLKAKLQANLEDSQIRGRVQVAIVERDSRGVSKYDPEMSDYFIERMKLQGFEARNNDEVVQYMVHHANDADLRVQARRIARGGGREDENSILRGTLTVDSTRKMSNGYEATVKASFEMIGLDSNAVDTVSRYFKAIGKTERDAIEAAKENATCKAMESLALQALETAQSEMKGGNVNIKTTLVFSNVTDFQNQFAAIQNGVKAAKCKIIRMTNPDATTVSLYVSTDAYSDLGSLKIAVMNSIPGVRPNGENEGVGSTKLLFTF